MRSRNLQIFSLLLFFLLVSNANAQLIKKLKNDWLVFDETSKQLFPFVEGNKSDLPLHFQLDSKRYRGQFLRIYTSEKVAMYVNHKFFQELETHKNLDISIDSISLNQNEPVLLSFFGKFNSYLIDSVAIVGPTSSIISESSFQLTKIPLKKNLNNGKNYFAFLLLISLGMLALFRNSYAKFFDQYVSVVGIFSDNISDKSQTKSSFDGYNFAFIFLSAFLFAMSFSCFPLFDDKEQNHTVLEYVGSMFNLMLLVVFFYFLKFLVTYSTSWLFSINKFSTSHFLIFVRISVLWSILLLFLTMLNYSEIEWLNALLVALFLILSLFFLTLISLKVSFLINRVAKVSSLYLISYLCITEWLPYFVILKLYMVYFY